MDLTLSQLSLVVVGLAMVVMIFRSTGATRVFGAGVLAGIVLTFVGLTFAQPGTSLRTNLTFAGSIVATLFIVWMIFQTMKEQRHRP